MFDVCPSQHDLNPPVGEVDAAKDEIVLTYETADAENPIKAHYERTLQAIQNYLEWLRPAATQTDGLKQVARAEIVRRKQASATHGKIVGSLGIPVKK